MWALLDALQRSIFFFLSGRRNNEEYALRSVLGTSHFTWAKIPICTLGCAQEPRQDAVYHLLNNMMMFRISESRETVVLPLTMTLSLAADVDRVSST
jgi:hypothetical protein